MLQNKLSLLLGCLLGLTGGSAAAQVIVDMPSPPPASKATSAEVDAEDNVATTTAPAEQVAAPMGAASIAGYLGRARPRMNPQANFGFATSYGYRGGYPYGYWGRGYPFGYGYGGFGFGFGHGHHHVGHTGHGHPRGTRIGGFNTIGHFSHQSSNFRIHIDF